MFRGNRFVFASAAVTLLVSIWFSICAIQKANMAKERLWKTRYEKQVEIQNGKNMAELNAFY